MATNGQLVFTDVDKVTFKGVGNTSNAVIDTTTGKIGVGVDSPDANLHVVGNCFVSTNFELGGTMTMGTVTVRAQHELSAITATGNTTPHTIEFSNATTGLVTTANVEVGKDLTVAGNVAVDTDTLFVDSVNDRVGIGTTSPTAKLHIKSSSGVDGIAIVNPAGGTGGNLNLSAGVRGGILISNGGGGTDGSDNYSSQPIVLTGGGTAATDGNIRGGSIWSMWGGSQYGLAFKGASDGDSVPEGGTTPNVFISSDKVGIGTTTPRTNLHIGQQLSAGNGNTIPAAGLGISADFPSSTHAWFANRVNATGDDYWGLAIGTIYNGSSYLQNLNKNTGTYYNLLLQPNGGNVGVGTTSPSAPLDVRGVDNPDMMAMFKTVSAAMRFHTGQGGTSNNWKNTEISLSGGSGGGAILFCFTMNNSSGDRSGAILYFIRKSHTADGTTNGDWNNDSTSVFKISGLNGGGAATSLDFQRNGNKLEYRTSNVGNGYFYAIEFD